MRRRYSQCSLADIVCIQWTDYGLGESQNIAIEYGGIIDKTEILAD